MIHRHARLHQGSHGVDMAALGRRDQGGAAVAVGAAQIGVGDDPPERRQPMRPLTYLLTIAARPISRCRFLPDQGLHGTHPESTLS